MGILYRLRSMRHFYMNTIIPVSQLKLILSKHLDWNVVYQFLSLKLREILQNLYKFQLLSEIKIVSIFNLRQFLSYKKSKQLYRKARETDSLGVFLFLCIKRLNSMFIRNMSKLINKTLLMKSCKSFLRYLSEKLNAQCQYM